MLHVVFIADCKQVGCDAYVKALSDWVNGMSGKPYARRLIISCPIASIREIPQTLNELHSISKGQILVGAITMATGHGVPGKMQLGSTWLEAKDFEQNLASPRVNWSPDGIIYLNPCSCAKGPEGLALCTAVAKYFAGPLPVSIVGPLRTMVGTPPPIWATAKAAVRAGIYHKFMGYHEV